MSESGNFDNAVNIAKGIAAEISRDSAALSEPRHVPPHYMVMLDHYARTVSFYRAILVLLQRKRFLDEPLSLARSLFEDALALRVVADMSEAHRVDAIYSWELDGINRAIGLMAHDAESAEIAPARTSTKAPTIHSV